MSVVLVALTKETSKTKIQVFVNVKLFTVMYTRYLQRRSGNIVTNLFWSIFKPEQ